MWTLLHRDNCYSRRSGQDHLPSSVLWWVCHTDRLRSGGRGTKVSPGFWQVRQGVPTAWSLEGQLSGGLPETGLAPRVPALADSQGAPSPSLKARRTGVPDVPLTSDAMLGGSSWSRSFEPPGLEDKTGLTTSSAPRRSPWGGASFGVQHRAWPSAASGWRGGRGQRLGPWCPPLPPVPHMRPPRPHLRLAARFAFGLPARRAFPAGSASAAAATRPRLLASAAPIPRGPARRALLRPFNRGCGRGRHEPGFGQSNPRACVGNILGPRRYGLGVEAKTPGRVGPGGAHKIHNVKWHADRTELCARFS